MTNSDSCEFEPRTPSWKVTQTNMIYIVGLPQSVAKEELLKSNSYCGQYGQITKVTIKKTMVHRLECYSAYITFLCEQSASLAVMALRNFQLNGNKISASYGTTKYCSSFLRYGKCRKFDCLYYHKIQPQKQIHQEDNWKVFNQQQNLARNYLVDNFLYIDFRSPFQNSIFPSKLSVKYHLMEESNIQFIQAVIQKRMSDDSTQYSFQNPQKEEDIEQMLLLKKIKKATSRKKSFFKFAEGEEAQQFQNVNRHLQHFLEDVSIRV